MKTRILRTALAAALLTVSAGSVQAETTASAPNTAEIRVINNYTSTVRVYVEDAFGRLRSIGTVDRSEAKILSVPESMTRRGAVLIKVFSDEPVWSPMAVPDGIRTMPLNLRAGDTVNFWVETDLPNSHLQLLRS